jgi:hypothetical protein
MKFSKDKTVAIALILLLTLSAAIAVTVQFEAHAADLPTFLFVTASPNPVGKGQACYIGAMFSRPAPTVSGWTGDLYQNVTIDITDPDGVKTVMGPYLASAAAGVQFTYTPSKVGNYTLQAHYPGQILTGTNPINPSVGSGGAQWRGSYMLPSDSNILTLVVNENPTEPMYQTPPIPTEFWTRPIYATNWEWGAKVASNWFGLGGNGVYDANRNFQPFGTAPNTAHIVWTKPTQFGGQPGGPISSDESSQFSSTSLIQYYFKPICILNGILYYNRYTDVNSNGMFRSGVLLGWEAVDIHTGETLWSKSAGITGTELIARGQIVNYNNYQEFGSNAFLWSSGAGGMVGIYDAHTGEWVANVTNYRSSSLLVDYESDLQGAVIGYYVSGGNLCMYNTTDLLIVHNPGGYDDQFFRPGSQGTIDGSMAEATEWSTPLPATFGGDNISLSIGAVTPDVILVRQVPNSMALANSGYMYAAGYDARTGAKLWGPLNQTWLDYKYESVDLLCAGDGYYVLHNKDRDMAYGYDLKTGKQLWGPVQLQGGGYSPVYRAGIIAYGKVYISDLGGYVNAIDLETGEVAWTYFAGESGVDTPFESYPIFGYNTHCIADGKLFLTEGIMYTPPMHPSYRLAINCTDGTLVWKILQYACTCVGPIADGYLISWNSFDNQIYSFGKGPSATTVSASPKVSVEGSSVLVEGTVIDKSGGTAQGVIATRFPDGLPAVSDASQEAWMEYAYMQQIRPADATGVEVTISVVDPNGNVYDVGTTTSNDMGFYSLAFTPAVPGKYTVFATFAGSESYYGSKAVTAINVENAPAATPAPTPTPAPMTDMYVLGIGAGAIITIVIVGLLLFLLLRKR